MKEFNREDSGYIEVSGKSIVETKQKTQRRSDKYWAENQRYYALVADKPPPQQKPSSKPKARFGPIDPEDNPRTSQSRGRAFNFERDEDRYDGPEYIRSRFSARSGTRNHTTLSMYSVKSSRVLDDEEDLERCSSSVSDKDNENGIDRPTDELIDLEDSLDKRPNGDIEKNGNLNGDRIIDEYDANKFENSGSNKVDILKITTPGDSSGKEEDNSDIFIDDVLERRLQALKSTRSPMLTARNPEENVKERRRSERFPDNTNLLANNNDNEKAEEERKRIEDEESSQRSPPAVNNQGSLQESASRINGEGSPKQIATAIKCVGSPQHSARANASEGSPQMGARAQRSEGSPESNLKERRRRFPDNENILQKKIEGSTEQRKLKQSNSFRGRSRVPVRRFKVPKNPQEHNAPAGNGNQKRKILKGPQSLDRNIPKRQSKEATTENKNQSPVTESFPPRPPSRPSSHDGRYSVDSLYLPDDHKKPEVDNIKKEPNDRDDDIREDSLERPHLAARDSLNIIRQDNNIEQKGADIHSKESEEENNQYSYSGYGYTTSQDSPQKNGEMLEQSADELKTTVEELEKRFDAIENEDEENEYASGNEWKTRFETQTEMNQQLERQILMLENKVEESKKNLKDAGKTPQEGQLFIDLADANPQLVKQLEKEKLGLINSIRDLEWRLDQESKAYHRANDERKQYVIEIQSTKGNIYQIQRQRAAGDATYRTPRVENGGNIPDDQRILDPKKGPIRKTAGVKTLPSLDSV